MQNKKSYTSICAGRQRWSVLQKGPCTTRSPPQTFCSFCTVYDNCWHLLVTSSSLSLPFCAVFFRKVTNIISEKCTFHSSSRMCKCRLELLYRVKKKPISKILKQLQYILNDWTITQVSTFFLLQFQYRGLFS